MIESVAVGAAVNGLAWLVTTPKGRAILGGTLAVLLLIPAVVVVMVIGAASAASTAAMGAVTGVVADVQARCYEGAATTADQDSTRWADLDVDQQALATTIVGVVKAATVLPGGADDTTQRRAAKVAIATAMQESTLANLPGGDRDSLGLFQQRPGMGWGTEDQILDPVYATTAFLYGAGTNAGLVDVVGWPTYAVTDAAQAVQRSGFPGAYAQWEALADDVVTQLWDVTPLAGVAPELDRPDLGDPATAVLRPVTATRSGASADCPLLTDTDLPAGTWDGATYTSPGRWGDYENGLIPLPAMCSIPWKPSLLGRCDAVDALVALDAAWQVDHPGTHLPISGIYRDYEAQKRTKAAKGNLAATPGKSVHGWGMAVDFSGFGDVGEYDEPPYLWMVEHGPTYGWVSPPWAYPGVGGPDEPWHWEFMGLPDPAAGPPAYDPRS